MKTNAHNHSVVHDSQVLYPKQNILNTYRSSQSPPKKARKHQLYLDLESSLAESFAHLTAEELLLHKYYNDLDTRTKNMLAARRVRILESLITRKTNTKQQKPSIMYSNKFKSGSEAPKHTVRSAEAEFGWARFLEMKRGKLPPGDKKVGS